MVVRAAATLPHLRRHGVLARLASSDRVRIARKVELVSLRPMQSLFGGNGTIEDVFFPLSAVLSQSGTTSEGGTIEISHIGREGIVGVEVALRTRFRAQPLGTTVVHIGGTALRMKADHFAEEVDQHPAVNRGVRRYMGFFFARLQQLVACGRHHTVEQRCARRLLTAQDLSGGTAIIYVTQHRLAQMLGVSRQSVDRTLHLWHEQGIVQVSRGAIRMADRDALAALACRCYDILARQMKEFLGQA